MPLRSTNKPLSIGELRKDNTPLEICLRVVNHVDAMLAYWDENEVCRFANKAYIKWAGKSGDALIGQMKMKNFLGPLYPENREYIKNVLAGRKQIFKREFNLPDGSVDHYIVTYTPDKIKGKVSGFFVHVANINLIKKLEEKLIDYEITKRREVLRSVIETQETERELISYKLRDKVNQTLASSKMMLDAAEKSKDSTAFLPMISRNIREVIEELNKISTDLSPSVIMMIGLVAGIKEYISNFEERHPLSIRFNCLDEKIENLSFSDKISIFRVVQNYLLLVSGNAACKIVEIEITRLNGKLILRLQNNDPRFKLPLNSKEFVDIEHRLEYYNGSWKTISKKNKNMLLLEFSIPS
ncbi:MAG TPA: PAS domain-containing protein [Ginsengibacter sp.]